MEFQPEAPQLLARYRELQQYAGWTEADARAIAAVAPLLRPHLPLLVDDFYAEIERHPAARKVITGGAAQVERLKGTLIRWLEEALAGAYDAAYVQRRWRVGYRHVEIGLDQVYTNMALSRLRSGLVAVLTRSWRATTPELHATTAAIHKLLDLDLAIIEDAYQAEYLARQQRAERLITIGQVAGGVAHEIRNPLNVIKTSVYYLLNAREASPDKVREHLTRVQTQVGAADAVVTALSNFARMPLPHMQPFDVRSLLSNTLALCELGSAVSVSLDLPADLPAGLGDEGQLAIVFANLFRNARDAMSGGGELHIEASVPGDGEIVVTVRDSGPGIPRENLSRIMEPLFTTKARGIGLGLAMARAIVEKHQGRIEASSEPGMGATFVVRLPAAR
jgi:signal transduction histidine kinase